MFDEMTVGELLKDLRGIKVKPNARVYIDSARAHFENTGSLPNSTQTRLRRICNNHKKQMKELHAARARARKTNGLRTLGISGEEAARRAEKRIAEVDARRRDVGF